MLWKKIISYFKTSAKGFICLFINSVLPGPAQPSRFPPSYPCSTPKAKGEDLPPLYGMACNSLWYKTPTSPESFLESFPNHSCAISLEHTYPTLQLQLLHLSRVTHHSSAVKESLSRLSHYSDSLTQPLKGTTLQLQQMHSRTNTNPSTSYTQSPQPDSAHRYIKQRSHWSQFAGSHSRTSTSASHSSRLAQSRSQTCDSQSNPNLKRAHIIRSLPIRYDTIFFHNLSILPFLDLLPRIFRCHTSFNTRSRRSTF